MQSSLPLPFVFISPSILTNPDSPIIKNVATSAASILFPGMDFSHWDCNRDLSTGLPDTALVSLQSFINTATTAIL